MQRSAMLAPEDASPSPAFPPVGPPPSPPVVSLRLPSPPALPRRPCQAAGRDQLTSSFRQNPCGALKNHGIVTIAPRRSAPPASPPCPSPPAVPGCRSRSTNISLSPETLRRHEDLRHRHHRR